MIDKKDFISLSSISFGQDETMEVIDSLLSTNLTMGKKVKKFEKSFAEYMGAKYAIMFNSGSSANLVALSILVNPLFSDKVNKGTNVITSAVTWATTIFPIYQVGLIPNFVDVQWDSLNINENLIEEAVDEDTSAIMAVHLMGNPCNIDKIVKIADKYDLLLIEDTCEAYGATVNKVKVGTFGDMGTCSFFMSHHLSTIEGGMLITDNREIYEIAKGMRAFGWIRDLNNKTEIIQENKDVDSRFLFYNFGFNLRPTEINASFGIHQLKKLDNEILTRQDNALFWDKEFREDSFLRHNFQILNIKDGDKCTYLGYPVLIKNKQIDRNDLLRYLLDEGIETRPIMSGNFLKHPVCKLFDYKTGCDNMNNADYISKYGFYFGCHSGVDKTKREKVVNIFKQYCRKGKLI